MVNFRNVLRAISSENNNIVSLKSGLHFLKVTDVFHLYLFPNICFTSRAGSIDSPHEALVSFLNIFSFSDHHQEVTGAGAVRHVMEIYPVGIALKWNAPGQFQERYERMAVPVNFSKSIISPAGEQGFRCLPVPLCWLRFHKTVFLYRLRLCILKS